MLDLKVCIAEVRRILLDECFTAAPPVCRHWAPRPLIGRSTPTTTESQVDDDVILGKLGRKVAGYAIEHGSRDTPALSVYCAIRWGLDIGRDGGGGAWPIPNLYIRWLPFHRVPSSTDIVKGLSEAVRGWHMYRTSAVEAVQTVRFSSLISILWHCAVVAGMDGNKIRNLVVDTLNNVQLATIRPPRFFGLPNRRPRTAARRHVVHIENSSMCPVRSFASDSDTVSARPSSREGGLVVTSEEESIPRRVSQV